MKLNKDDFDYSKVIVNESEKFIIAFAVEPLDYLYPNGHRSTPQMRWFKGSRDRGFRSNLAA